MPQLHCMLCAMSLVRFTASPIPQALLQAMAHDKEGGETHGSTHCFDKDALKHVNKRIGQARGFAASSIDLPVLFGAAGLVAFGCLIIWTAFSYHFCRIFFAAPDWYWLGYHPCPFLLEDRFSRPLQYHDRPYGHRYHRHFLALCSRSFSYSAKGMTGWIQIPLIHLTFQPVELVKIITVFIVAALGRSITGVSILFVIM